MTAKASSRLVKVLALLVSTFLLVAPSVPRAVADVCSAGSIFGNGNSGNFAPSSSTTLSTSANFVDANIPSGVTVIVGSGVTIRICGTLTISSSATIVAALTGTPGTQASVGAGGTCTGGSTAPGGSGASAVSGSGGAGASGASGGGGACWGSGQGGSGGAAGNGGHAVGSFAIYAWTINDGGTIDSNGQAGSSGGNGINGGGTCSSNCAAAPGGGGGGGNGGNGGAVSLTYSYTSGSGVGTLLALGGTGGAGGLAGSTGVATGTTCISTVSGGIGGSGVSGSGNGGNGGAAGYTSSTDSTCTHGTASNGAAGTAGASGTVTETQSTVAGLALDGHCSSTGTSTVGCSITTTGASDIMIVMVATDSGTPGTPSGGATYSSRATTTASGETVSEFYSTPVGALSAVTVSDSISGGTSPLSVIIVLGISGADTSSPFDPNLSTPPTAGSGSSGTPSTSFSTLGIGDFLLGLLGVSAAATQTAGSGFSLAESPSQTGQSGAAEYLAGASGSSQTVAFGTSVSSPWLLQGDAIYANNTVPEFPMGLLPLLLAVPLIYYLIRTESKIRHSNTPLSSSIEDYSTGEIHHPFGPEPLSNLAAVRATGTS